MILEKDVAMTVQTIELAGHRFVILPEEEFQQLKKDAEAAPSSAVSIADRRPAFARVTPLSVGGTPASEMLLQDRR
jgi:hypothetical protein